MHQSCKKLTFSFKTDSAVKIEKCLFETEALNALKVHIVCDSHLFSNGHASGSEM